MQFDWGATGAAGAEGFIRNVSGAFPVLSCNLDVSREPALQGLVQRYALVELPLSGLTAGIVGLTSVETPETSNPGDTVAFLPYDDVLPACVAEARAAGANFIVALTHIGFDADQALAASAAAADVDLIVGAWAASASLRMSRPAQPAVDALCRTGCDGKPHMPQLRLPPAPSPPPAGGHTHTFLHTGPAPPLLLSPPTNETTVAEGPYPTLVANPASGKDIPIVQALYGSRYLGMLNTTWANGSLVAAAGAPLLLGGKNSTNPVEGERRQLP